MKKNNNFWIILTVASVVALHILAESKLFPPLWAKLLDVLASLVIVVAIAYVALGKHANICILSGAQRELAAKNQQVSSVNLLGGTKFYLAPRDDGVIVDTSFVNIMGGCDRVSGEDFLLQLAEMSSSCYVLRRQKDRRGQAAFRGLFHGGIDFTHQGGISMT